MKAWTWIIIASGMVFSLNSSAEDQQPRSRVTIARSVLYDVEQRFDALPWTHPSDGEFSKLGAYAMHAVPGYSWAVLKQAIETGVRKPSFLLGDSLLEQVQFLYLHSEDDFEQRLNQAVGPRSELWTSSPVDAVKFARAVATYTPADATADDVLSLVHVAIVPFAVFVLVSLYRSRRSRSSDQRPEVFEKA